MHIMAGTRWRFTVAVYYDQLYDRTLWQDAHSQMFGQQLAGRLGVTLLPGKTDGRALASRPHIQRQVRIPLLMIQCVARQRIINHKTAEGPIGLVDLSHSFFTILSLSQFLSPNSLLVLHFCLHAPIPVLTVIFSFQSPRAPHSHIDWY